jgi:RNA polymerase sigma factor (sigma-70 family)
MNGEAHTETGGSFPTTQWTLIIKAIQQGDNASAESALSRFCEKYRPAVVNFFRRRGCRPEQAEDFAQEFFLKKIHKPWANRSGLVFDVDRNKTTLFRSFLATALHFFLIDQWRREKPPSERTVSIGEPPESAADRETDSGIESKAIQNEIDRAVAVQVIGDAIKRAQPSPFHLRFWNDEISQKEAAASLNQSEDAFTQSYKRFRKRLRDELRKAVGEMIADPSDIDSEIKYLLSIFAGSRASPSNADSRNTE